MKILIYDVEADNLLLDATRMWCLVTKDLHTGEITRFTPENIHEAFSHLCSADRLVGHNVRGYDDPVTARLIGDNRLDLMPPSIDTMLISRLVYPDRKNNPIQGHSLEAWGKFLNCHKGDYTDFSQYTPEMLEYCEQDVNVTEKIYRYLLPYAKKMPEAAKLEHQVASIITQQIQNGFTLHEGNHAKLTKMLEEDRAVLLDKLIDIPPFIDHKTMKKRWWVGVDGTKYATKGEAPKEDQKNGDWGDCIVKTVETAFNHQSGDHIARLFKEKYGWKPAELSETGKPKTSRDVLKKLDYPEAKVLMKLSVIDKVLGTYANAWHEHNRDGRIHGQIITNGAVTGRMTHHSPNLNVSRVVTKKNADGKKEVVWGFDGKYGADCRSCFRAREGWNLVGCDAEGLEARMLAHFMYRWDGGEFASLVLDESIDIHTRNQALAGVESRDVAKTVLYAVMYGAGPKRVAETLGKPVSYAREVIDRFYDGIPALKKIDDWAKRQSKMDGYLTGLDGRILPIRKEYAALNTLLQSAGAVVMKKALVLFFGEQERVHGKHGGTWALCANVHDEQQMETEPGIAKDTGQRFADSITKAGEHFNLNIRLDGKYAVGETWFDTH